MTGPLSGSFLRGARMGDAQSEAVDFLGAHTFKFADCNRCAVISAQHSLGNRCGMASLRTTLHILL